MLWVCIFIFPFQVLKTKDPKADEIVLSNMAVAFDRIFLDVKVVTLPVYHNTSCQFSIIDITLLVNSTCLLLWTLGLCYPKNYNLSGSFWVLTSSQSNSRTIRLLCVWPKLHSSFNWLQVVNMLFNVIVFNSCYFLTLIRYNFLMASLDTI